MSSTPADAAAIPAVVEAAEIPEVPEALTAEWLSGALGFPIRSVRRQILGEGQGFLGDIVRLHIDSDAEGAPASVVAKMPKLANRDMGELMGVYERESHFFRELAPDVPVRLPHVYFSHCDEDAGSQSQKGILAFCDRMPSFMHPWLMAIGKRAATGKNRRYLLIMEDLAGFEAGDQLEGASLDACARVLEQFAATHRAFWGSPRLDESFWLMPLDLDARMRAGLYRKSVPALREIAPPELLPWVDTLRDLGGALVRRLAAEAPRTLIHCDLRLDNVCFDGDRCAFLDWQLVRSGPAAYDVGYFLGGALPPDTSAADEQGLLRAYHDALGVADYGFERFERDYQRGLLASLTVLAPSADFEIDEGRGEAMMQRWRERLVARLAHVDVDRLL